ncbi:MAG: N-6 DNA methylase [Armatimonadetes bacterium]|nr:N-6 DNA methylase [Armatimonadota bacterium]MDE2205477.1 N-6 DNA methylase [Armatimonadota bacterium]
MQVKRRDIFTTVRTEGGILPADLLQRVVSADRSVEGLSPEDYHLAPSEKINEAINRAWNRLQGSWETFRAAAEKLPTGDPGTSVTRERWLLPLFQELGYGRLQTAKATEIDGKSYAVSHAWGHVPIHLVGCLVELDRPTRGVAGAARSSPHSLTQELLNRSDEHLWAFVSNGRRLRILRDNKSLTRQSYVEFDLESVMEGEVYADFVLLWLLCHESRVEAERPEQCWLEKWSRAAQEQGTRALDQLRDGVEKAITALGKGFVAHPANRGLRDCLRSGSLSTQDYYRQLLRVVYRLLFLFVAEDRELLLDPGASQDARARYLRFYASARLRRLAERQRGTRHSDLYAGLSIVLDNLYAGLPALGLPALGSFLFSSSATSDLNACEIANHDLLDAIRALAFTLDGRIRRAVDYKNLRSEELGSVYEALLELHPELNVDAGTFGLRTAGGSERKTTGSYYTPDSLVQCLLDSALDPVVDEAVKKPNPEQAILDLKVCDPACGSGHFLIAAAHRIAKRLASVRTGDEEPSPAATRTALRDIIGRCIYGVDLNPMAVELCKVALWMEALEPGRPLCFLDHHIQCGNSLVGATPALIENGIPDAAFDPIEGDDKAVCTEFKRRNRTEREGQGSLYDANLQPWERLGDLTTGIVQLSDLPDDTLAGVQTRQARYEELVRSQAYENGKMLADAWCAAFVWKKTREADRYPLTTAQLRRILRSPHNVEAWMRHEIEQLAQEYRFLHWHLAFPDVFRIPGENETADDAQSGWIGGFHIVLGNPPWDTLSPDQREFFSRWVVGLRSLAPGEQKEEVEKLLADTFITSLWTAHCRNLFALVHFLKSSGVYTLYAPGNLGKGDFNVYRMFVELAVRRVRPAGLAAQIAPAGLYGGANASAIRKFMLDENRLMLLVGCENKGRVFFPHVHPQTWFTLYALQRGGRTARLSTAFGIDSVEKALSVRAETIELDADLIRELAPDTYAIADLRSLSELATNQKINGACPAFGNRGAGPPIRHYQREIDMGNDRDLFTSDPRGLPVYEGRMIDHYDHRAKTYQSGHGNSAIWIERPFTDPEKAVVPQWRVLPENIPSKLGNRCTHYRIGFGDVANPRNERSFVATLIPPGTICGHTVPTITFEPGYEWAYLPWLAVANSFVMDAFARRKLSSPHMTYTVLDSLPFPRPSLTEPLVHDVARLVLRLICTAPEMAGYWNHMAELGLVERVPPDTIPLDAFRTETARIQARARIEAIVAIRVFSLTRDELCGALDTFDVLQRREVIAFGDYQTKRVTLEAFDEMWEAIETGAPYRTRLDPPPPNGWTPPEELLKDTFATAAAYTPAKAETPIDREEPADFALVSPPASPKPILDKDGEVLRVRVYDHKEQVVLNRGVAVGREKRDGTSIWKVLADGEKEPRSFASPPFVLKWLRAR